MMISDLQTFMAPGRRCHLIGIGGVSMSPLAEVLQNMGLVVTGSDIAESAAVLHLRELGIPVAVGHAPENIRGAEFIIRTAAAHDDNPEVAAARNTGIPVFERAQAWGYIMRSYPNALCIAGTHGKTTTTSMATHILMAAQADPTVMIGGTLPLLHAGHRVGKGNTIVLESCEYYDSFLSFSPTVAVILNVDADHLDYFHDLEDVKASFRSFAELVPADGHVIANRDDRNSMDALAGIDRSVTTFGFSPEADVQAADLKISGGKSEFDVLCRGSFYTHVRLQVPGRHNVLNALAASAAAHVLGLPGSAVTEGLAGFTGAGRRFEYKGVCSGADVYDDYAHHPGELKSLLDTATELGYDRIILAFQPHTYSRTKALFDDFAAQLARADLPLLADIYAARETNTIGISSRDLADAVPGARYCASFDEMERVLRSLAKPGDLILTVGAGDIYKVGEAIVER